MRLKSFEEHLQAITPQASEARFQSPIAKQLFAQQATEYRTFSMHDEVHYSGTHEAITFEFDCTIAGVRGSQGLAPTCAISFSKFAAVNRQAH